MKKKRKCTHLKCSTILRPMFIILALCSGLSVGFSLDNERLAESLDTAFIRQSRAELTRILEQTQSTPTYRDVETYAIKKIREALIFNRLEFAEFASLSLININLNNFEALDLYTRIGTALAARQEQERQEETVRLAELKEEQKQIEPVSVAVEQDFEQRVSADGQNVYFDLSELSRFSPFNWGVNAKLVSLSLLSNPAQMGMKYGVGLAGEFFYNASSISIGSELDLSAYIITLLGDENLVSDFTIVPAIAFLDLSEHLYFRVGFKGIFDNASGENSYNASFLTPLFGLEWKKIEIGSTQTRVAFDYLIGHIALENVQTAFDLGLRTIVPITDLGSFTFNALFDFSNTLILINNDIQNNAKFTIGLGVGNYE